jgi:hypothetical protein
MGPQGGLSRSVTISLYRCDWGPTCQPRRSAAHPLGVFALNGILAVVELAANLGAIDRNPHLGLVPWHYKNLLSSLSSPISRAPRGTTKAEG